MKENGRFDPYEAEASNKYDFSPPAHIDKSITDETAVRLWNTVMRKVTEKNDHDKVLFKPAGTASSSLARKIQQFLDDSDHIDNKFYGEPPKMKEIYKAAKFSSSKWGRIMSGELADVERGNAFALAVALRLNTEQTEELLYSAGFALNYELDLDAAMMFFIKQEIYDLDYIFSVLECFSNIKNGLDCFVFQPRTDKQKPL